MRGRPMLLLLAFLLLFGCARSGEPKEARTQFLAMDTVMTFRAYGDSGAEALSAAERAVYRLEAALSTELEESEIYAVNDGGVGVVGEDARIVLECALTVYRETGGAFDITIYPLMRAWGFRSGEYRVPGDAELSALHALVGSDGVTLSGNTVTLKRPGSGIDLGAIGKGYASDAAAAAIRAEGVSSAILSLGGNVYAVGKRPDGSDWLVAIQDPFEQSEMVGAVAVSDMAVVTSGGYQRFFIENGKRYHHIIDPRTGRPSESGLASVTVICDSGMMADALSTALFVLGEEGAIAHWRAHSGEFDAVLVTDEGAVLVTQGLEGRFSGAEHTILLREAGPGRAFNQNA